MRYEHCLAAYSSYLIWIAHNPQWNTGKNFRRRLFLQEIRRALIEPHLQQRSKISQLQKSVQEAMNAVGIVRSRQHLCEGEKQEQEPCEDRGRCVFCPLRKRVRQNALHVKTMQLSYILCHQGKT